jgi:hypothetical protein
VTDAPTTSRHVRRLPQPLVTASAEGEALMPLFTQDGDMTKTPRPVDPMCGLLPLFRASRRGTVANNLAAHLGGKWRYDGRGTWWCGKRHVSRCAASGSDEDNPAVEYWLYGAGVPERAEKYLFPKPKAKH